MYVHTCTQAGSSMLTLKLWKLGWNAPSPSAHSEVGSIDACLCQDSWTYCYHMGMSSPYWPLMNTDLLTAQLYCVKCFLSWTCCCYFMFMTTVICRRHICLWRLMYKCSEKTDSLHKQAFTYFNFWSPRCNLYPRLEIYDSWASSYPRYHDMIDTTWKNLRWDTQTGIVSEWYVSVKAPLSQTGEFYPRKQVSIEAILALEVVHIDMGVDNIPEE